VGYCPECEALIEDEEIEEVGEIVTCPECGGELEVISLDPVEFDLAPVDDEDEYSFDDEDEEEDWDEDSYTEDDYDDEDEDEENY